VSRPVIGQFASEPSALRKALVVALLPVALFAAVIVQLTVVNRLPLPGGDAPDLVLLLVTAVAVNSNPMTGALTGFAGGLALDIAPPATHYAGEYALVYCLTGYFAAWIVEAVREATGERNPIVALAVMAAATAAGEAGKAGLGLLLSDPNVTGPAIKHVLPGAILYDLLLTPVAFWLVSWVAGLARPAAERAPAPVFLGPQRLASAFRLASTGAAPNLRLAGTGAKFGDARRARPRPDPEARLHRRQIRDYASQPEESRQGLDPRHRSSSRGSGWCRGRDGDGDRDGKDRDGADRGRRPSVAVGRLAPHRQTPAGCRPSRRAGQGLAPRRPSPAGCRPPRRAGQGLAPPGSAAPRELVLKRSFDPLGTPLPRQKPVAHPGPIAVGRADVGRP
jgi:rod shape-determining protein MreD